MTPNTADVWDERGAELYSIALPFHDFGAIRKFSGPVRTVRCHEDNALFKSIVSTPGGGAVMVVDGGGSLAAALMGDMIATLAIENEWAGVVVYGAIRDRVALSSMQLGIKALGSNPRKSSKTGAGEADVLIELGGATIRPGAMLFADEDGILVER